MKNKKAGCFALILLLPVTMLPIAYLLHIGLTSVAAALAGLLLLNIVIALLKPRRV